MRAMHLALAAAALAPFTSAQACGACAEDKVAATYDHAIASRAASQGRTMVFCEVRGPFDARRLKAAAMRIDGIDPASLRTSANPATVSFALCFAAWGLVSAFAPAFREELDLSRPTVR